MLRSSLLPFILLLLPSLTLAQKSSQLPEKEWIDSVVNSLTEEEKIAQLLVLRLSSINPNTREIRFYDEQVAAAIRKYNIGGICLFQGNPHRQANLINRFQSITQTPILIMVDAENGLGMRMDSVLPLPRQMMLGAVQDPQLLYRYGQAVGRQCRRMGIHINLAPVLDVNNNPENPVINDRSFGELPDRVAEKGLMYMKGMQDAGIMACAKHFPGHGDVRVDSHLDLPVINKSKTTLDGLELVPFQRLIRAGISSVMTGHLSVPALDDRRGRGASVSSRITTGLLRQEMGFDGLILTDALDMKGVTRFFPEGEAAVQALLAGNDMLCLPGDAGQVIGKIKEAIQENQISQETLEQHLRRVLRVKYRCGLNRPQSIQIRDLTADLNQGIDLLKAEIAASALTVVSRPESRNLAQPLGGGNKIACILLGRRSDNAFAARMRRDYNADVFFFDYHRPATDIDPMLQDLRRRYESVVIGVHGMSRFPAGNFGLSEAAVTLVNKLDAAMPLSVFLFGNPYAARNFRKVANLTICYEDQAIVHEKAADLLQGKIQAHGRLPVTVCPGMPAGSGIETSGLRLVDTESSSPKDFPWMVIDSIATDAIYRRAIPGCVVLVQQAGRIRYFKSFGHFTYDSLHTTTTTTLYDLASVTKIAATTLAVMKLYELGKIGLNDQLVDHLPWVRGSNKAGLRIRDILLHQAGLKAWIPFSNETIDTISGQVIPGFFADSSDNDYGIPVARNMYMKNSWRDTMDLRIVQSALGKPGDYIYSDNDFIFLGRIVEARSGMSLADFVRTTFYQPMGLHTIGFLPLDKFKPEEIAPTEMDGYFRKQLIQGYVHDPGAAMYGGVSGHAGLFSQALDLGAIMQMLLNGGEWNGRRFLSASTISMFTAYGSRESRRGLGFDKPEKDNQTRKDPYPCKSASFQTYGHTGFTGTCAWTDPGEELVFIFLSNRVYPNAGTLFQTLNVRGKIHEAIYRAKSVDQKTLVPGHGR